MRNLLCLILFFIIVTGGTVFAGSQKVPLSNFKILSFRGVWGEFGTLRIIGEVKNIGNVAAGVEIEGIARNANGTLVDVKRIWPNSIGNIPAGGSVGFKFAITEDKSAETVSVGVVNAQIW